MNWKPIPGFPGYEASTDGHIRGKKGGVLATWEGHSRGSPRVYQKVGLYRHRNGQRERKRIAVHRLVALAHLGEAPGPGMDVAHGNHCTTDNRLSNLSWQTKSRNIEDTFSEEARERRAIYEEAHGHLHYYGASRGTPF